MSENPKLSDRAIRLLLAQARFEAKCNGAGSLGSTYWRKLEQRVGASRNPQQTIGALYGAYSPNTSTSKSADPGDCPYCALNELVSNTYIRAIEGIGGTEGLSVASQEPRPAEMPLDLEIVHNLWEYFHTKGIAQKARIGTWIDKLSHVEGRSWEHAGADEETTRRLDGIFSRKPEQKIKIIYLVYGDEMFKEFRKENLNGIEFLFQESAIKHFSTLDPDKIDPIAGIGQQTRMIIRGMGGKAGSQGSNP